MSGALWSRLAWRGSMIGAIAAAQRRDALARELARVPGVAAEVEGETVVLRGRGLAARLADDSRLRFAGRSG